ncbi:MAG: hypothetical protein AB1778_07375 [Candidatus Bipolaricaulota bacterium]
MIRLRVALLWAAAAPAVCWLSLAAAALGEEWSGNPFAAPREPLAVLAADRPERVAETLAGFASRIRPLSRSVSVRHRIADATFCLPQNALGILLYALLELTGSVVSTAEGGGVRLIATSLPIGISLGTYVFVGETLLSERVIAHELGHTAQSYRRGPFYLAAEGVTSFVQATLSLFSPAFARGYFDRWPEDEADALGVTFLLPLSP